MFNTKKIYLCELQQIDKKVIIDNNDFELSFLPGKKYILAKKVNNSILDSLYIDILTKIKYENNCHLNHGDWYITKQSPIITDTRYITRENAIDILRSLKPVFTKNNKVKTLKKIKNG